MKIKQLNFILFFVMVTVVLSCSKNDDSLIPSYIKIDTLILKSEAAQGSASHKITDVWVFSKSGLIGVYELPADIPILEKGNTDLSIYAGIKLNGITATRVEYPFYKPVSITPELVNDSVINLSKINIEYVSDCNFAWLEDFENDNFSFRTTSNGKVLLQRTTESSEIFSLPGETNKSSVKATLTNDSVYLEYASYEAYKLPTDGERKTFLELNYKNNAEFAVGLLVNGTSVEQRPVVIVNPSEKWNKIYINLTYALNQSSDANNFRVYIKMVKPEDVEKAYLYLDNIKLIHSK